MSITLHNYKIPKCKGHIQVAYESNKCISKVGKSFDSLSKLSLVMRLYYMCRFKWRRREDSCHQGRVGKLQVILLLGSCERQVHLLSTYSNVLPSNHIYACVNNPWIFILNLVSMFPSFLYLTLPPNCLCHALLTSFFEYHELD